MTNDATKPGWGARAAAYIEHASALRDTLLIAAGVLYVAGYVAWSINAYRNNMGMLPALEFQYFVAGIGPVLVILVVISVYKGVRFANRWLRDEWLGDDPPGWKYAICWTMAILAVIGFIALFNLDKFPEGWTSWPALIAVFLIIVSYPFVMRIANTPETAADAKQSALRRAFASVVDQVRPILGFLITALAPVYFLLFLAVGAFAAMVYSIELYPKIPQEFGGARPFEACLDIKRENISDETATAIVPTTTPVQQPSQTPPSVARSSRVEVLFSGSDVMIVRSAGKVYKLDRASVQAITGCE